MRATAIGPTARSRRRSRSPRGCRRRPDDEIRDAAPRGQIGGPRGARSRAALDRTRRAPRSSRQRSGSANALRADAVGQGGPGEPGRRAPDEAEHRHPGDDPERGVQPVRDRLRAVRAGRQHAAVERQREHPLEQRPPQPARLLLRVDEEHGQEPQRSAVHRRPECHDASAPRRIRELGHQEAARIRAERMRVQPAHARVVLRELRHVQPSEVAVEGVAPDPVALEEVRLRGAGGSGARRGQPPSLPPVASRSSSACMNASRSPSRTAARVATSRAACAGP